MPDVKFDTGKLAQAEKAYRDAKEQFDAGEARATNWIARHPVWTLAIGIVLLVADIYQALRHL